MDGYRFMIERNRLMYKLEDELAKIRHLPEIERRAKRSNGVQRKIAGLCEPRPLRQAKAVAELALERGDHQPA